MNERKCCTECGKPLIAFQGHYLHPESPCSGIIDSIDIDATISDEETYNIFIGKYGKPEVDDYDRVTKLEEMLNHPVIKFMGKFVWRKNGKKGI